MKLIAAISKNNCIGKNNKIPWKFPEDMRHFRETTIYNYVLMGYNTWKSIGKRPLEQRCNIVLNEREADKFKQLDGGRYLVHVQDYRKILEENKYVEKHRSPEHIYLIGGAKTYQKFLDLDVIDELIITHINIEVDGDAFFFIPDGWEIYKEKILSENCIVKYYKRV